MRFPITLPELGTGGTTVRISGWLVDRGDKLVEGDRIVEVLLPGISFDVLATHSGQLVEITQPVDSNVTCGSILGWIEIAESQPVHCE